MNTNHITIQQETSIDTKSLLEIHQLAFERDDEAILVDRLRTSPAYVPELSLVAVAENTIVGHILFTEISIRGSDKRDVHLLALAPVSVLPAFQNQGVGGLLIRAGLVKAAAIGYSAVIVLGHADYYPKFGFVPASKWGIHAPFEVPDVNFMAIELVPHALEDLAGVVEYAPEFGV